LAEAVGPTGSLDAVDVEKEIVQQCEERFEEAGVSDFARSHVLSVYNLSDHFEENAFDVCYANQLLQHLSEPVKALREIKRVVKKTGGIVALRDADYASMLCHPTYPGIERWREVYRQTARKNEAEPDAGRHLLDWTVSSGVFQRNSVEFTTDVKVRQNRKEGAPFHFHQDTSNSETLSKVWLYLCLPTIHLIEYE
jgi:ubiquinone/menaquinone biosynthesis C-methylase UbiE